MYIALFFMIYFLYYTHNLKLQLLTLFLTINFLFDLLCLFIKLYFNTSVQKRLVHEND